MSVKSQNGWPAFHTAEEGHFVRINVAGRGFWAANDDVAVVFGEMIQRFNDEVEPVNPPGEKLNDWSFADRLVRGSLAAVSNHGSATAIDLNSDKHPLGVEGTFSTVQTRQIHAILDDLTDNQGGRVLRWGGDYLNRKDEMHFEIVANSVRVRQAADKIRKLQKERDMPTKEEMRAVLVDVLLHEPLFTNKPTDAELAADPKAVGGKVTLAWLLQNIEQDQDNDRARDRADRARLESKVDQLLARLTPPPA